IDCECPHSLIDRLLKSVDPYRVSAAYSTQSLVFVKRLNRSFYCLLTLACCAVSVRAHYREPRFLRKGFLVKNVAPSTECRLTQQTYSLATGLCTASVHLVLAILIDILQSQLPE